MCSQSSSLLELRQAYFSKLNFFSIVSKFRISPFNLNVLGSSKNPPHQILPSQKLPPDELTKNLKMNSLPPELNLMIFKLLPVADTLRLRLVSKKWYYLLACLKHKHLSIHDVSDPEGYYNNWDHPIKTVHTVECRDEYLLLSTPVPAMLRSVRKLTANFYSERIVDISKFYNQFTQLEELTCYHESYVANTIILNLQHLNKLTIERYYNSCNFDLRTPCLTHLVVPNYSSCDLYYPERLRRLEANLYDQDRIDFQQLKNLEFLHINGEDWTVITNSFLITLSNLKELHFEADTFLNRDTLRSNFTYRRDGLRLYLFGFDIDRNVDIVEDEDFPGGKEENNSKFINRNYEKTAETVYYKPRIDYTELIKTGLKKNFFTKFPRLTGVKISDKVEDEEALLNFLTKTEPSKLSMENCLLSQTILHRIALQCTLRDLELKNVGLDVTCPEFEFIFNLENLETIQAYQQISTNFLVKAFQLCKHLSEVRFIIDDLNDASFIVSEVTLITLMSQVAHEDLRDYLEAYLYFESNAEFLYFLRALRKESELIRKPDDLRELIFLINDYKHNKTLEDREFRRLLKGEVFYVYS